MISVSERHFATFEVLIHLVVTRLSKTFLTCFQVYTGTTELDLPKMHLFQTLGNPYELIRSTLFALVPTLRAISDAGLKMTSEADLAIRLLTNFAHNRLFRHEARTNIADMVFHNLCNRALMFI